MHVLSRKTKVNVERAIGKILSGTFTESTIKELMIDLRELSRDFPRIGLSDPMFIKSSIEFVEICDFLVHSNRNKGVFETKIREHAERMADALASGDELLWQGVSKVKPAGNIDQIITGMLSAAFLLLSSFDKSLNNDLLKRVYIKKTEISLCIISLLQDSIINLKGDRGHAILNILTFRGFFRLYCSIHDSRIHKEAKARTSGTGRLAIGFPVLVTDAIDSDHILPHSAPDFVMGSNIFKAPTVFETFRAPSGRLCLRPLFI